jgi:hypothetical protein
MQSISDRDDIGVQTRSFELLPDPSSTHQPGARQIGDGVGGL